MASSKADPVAEDVSDDDEDELPSKTLLKSKKRKKSPISMRNKQGLTPAELAYQENT